MVLRHDEILARALALPREEREEIAERLLESLDGEDGSSVSAAWDREIEARLRRYDAGEERAVPWTEVRDRLEAKRRAG